MTIGFPSHHHVAALTGLCRIGAFIRVQRKWSLPATETIRAVDVLVQWPPQRSATAVTGGIDQYRKTPGDIVCKAGST
jgi:hypothetical protein